MSHDLDVSTGKPAMAYVGVTPWHQLGEKLPENQGIEVWLKAARLEWNLKRLPVQYLSEGKMLTMEDRFVLVRDDTQDALSVVSGDYRIVQPNQVLEFYRDLVEASGYALETAGALNGGRKVWALARTGLTGSAGAGDGLAAYLLLATSCDKTLATTVAFTSVRVVCQNTLFFAVADINNQKRPQVKVPHTLQFDPNDVKTQLGLVEKGWGEFLEQVKKLAAHKLSQEQASEYFDRLVYRKDSKALSAKAQSERDTLDSFYRDAPGQNLETASQTLWGALNAVTYYADHVRTGTGDRLDSSWFGAGSALKAKAWQEATKILDAV